MAQPVVVLGVSVTLDQSSISALQTQIKSSLDQIQGKKGIEIFIDPNKYNQVKQQVAGLIDEVSKTSGNANANAFAKNLLTDSSIGLSKQSANALISDANKLTQQIDSIKAKNQREFEAYITSIKVFSAGNIANQLGIPVIGQIANNIGSSIQIMGGSLGIAGAAFVGFGIAATGAMTQVARESIRVSAEIQTSMTKIAALTGVARNSLNEMYVGVAQLSSSTGKSQKELADALYFITSSGFKDKSALDVLSVSAKASAAGLGEVKTVADVVTSALNAYRGAGYDAAKVTDILIATIREGKAEPEQLARSLGQILPIAKAAGISLEEVSSAVATLTINGLSAPQAVTAAKQAIQALVAPSKEAALALDQIYGSGQGVATVSERLKTIGLVGTLKEIFTAFGNNNIALDAIFGNIRGLVGALSLSNDGFAQFNGILKEVNGSLGATDQAFATTVNTFESGSARLGVAIQNTLVNFGLLGFANDIINRLSADIKDLSGQSAVLERTLVLMRTEKNAYGKLPNSDLLKSQYDAASADEKKTIVALYRQRLLEINDEIAKITTDLSNVGSNKTLEIQLKKQLMFLEERKNFYNEIANGAKKSSDGTDRAKDYIVSATNKFNSLQEAINGMNYQGNLNFVKGDANKLIELEAKRIELQGKAFDDYTSQSIKAFSTQISNIEKLVAEGARYESYLDKLDAAREKLNQTPSLVQAKSKTQKTKPPTAGQVAKAITELGDTQDDIKKINASKSLTPAQKADRIAQQNLIDERARSVLERASQTDIKTARAQLVNNPKYAQALDNYIQAQQAVLKEQFNETSKDVSQLAGVLGNNIADNISKSIASGLKSSAQGIKAFDSAFGPIKQQLADGLINLAHDAGLTATRGFQFAFGSELAKISLTDQIKKLTDDFTNGLLTEKEYNVKLKPLLQLFYSKDEIIEKAIAPIEGFLKDPKTITYDALVQAKIIIDQKSATEQINEARKQLTTFQGKNGGIDNWVKDEKDNQAIEIIKKVSLKLEFSSDIKSLIAEGSQPEAIAKIAQQLISDELTAKGITIDASKVKTALTGTLGIDQASVKQSIQDAITSNQGDITALIQPSISVQGGGKVIVGDDFYNQFVKSIKDQLEKPVTVSPTVTVNPLPDNSGGGKGAGVKSSVKPTKTTDITIENDLSIETQKIDDQFSLWTEHFSTSGSITKSIDFSLIDDISDEWDKLFEMYESGKKKFESEDTVDKRLDFTFITDLESETAKLIDAINTSLTNAVATPRTIEQVINVVYKVNSQTPTIPATVTTTTKTEVSDANDRKGYAKGGTVDSSGIYWVGEQGKELVYLPTGARVFNSNESDAISRGINSGRYSDVRQYINNVGPTSNVTYAIDARQSESPSKTQEAVRRGINFAQHDRLLIRRNRELGRR